MDMFVSTVNRWLMDTYYLRVLGQPESNTRSMRSRGKTGQRDGTVDTDMVCPDRCEHTTISCSVGLAFLTWPMIRVQFGRSHNLCLHWNSDLGGRACRTKYVKVSGEWFAGREQGWGRVRKGCFPVTLLGMRYTGLGKAACLPGRMNLTLDPRWRKAVVKRQSCLFRSYIWGRCHCALRSELETHGSGVLSEKTAFWGALHPWVRPPGCAEFPMPWSTEKAKVLWLPQKQ